MSRAQAQLYTYGRKKPTKSLARMRETVHHLKVHPEPFVATRHLIKHHETRVEDDRRFSVGDYLHLMEWDPDKKKFTGEDLWRKVTYLTRGPAYGLPAGMVVMSIEGVSIEERQMLRKQERGKW